MTRIRIVERTGSTNTDMLGDANAVEGDWLVALEQSAGKGRQGRTWVSTEGNFAGSTIATLRPGDPPAATLSLAAGLALAEAIDVAIPAQALMLKWPNDLMLLGRKVAGILLERSGDRVAIGFGVNLASAPVLPDREAANFGGKVTPQAFAPLLAASFARLLELWRTSESAALARAWQERAHPPGTRLTVHVSKDEVIGGSFAGLDADGALRMMLDDGSIQVIRAADVFLS
ncbi:MAG TPA: biotin--[acetyl-CoA-carboxylase] ligase [Sphingomicrobium sp.]|nr:biotin--[acetyl-CoA-carboxylase] ligase [Sphingomicrobium sp.]